MKLDLAVAWLVVVVVASSEGTLKMARIKFMTDDHGTWVNRHSGVKVSGCHVLSLNSIDDHDYSNYGPERFLIDDQTVVRVEQRSNLIIFTIAGKRCDGGPNPEFWSPAEEADRCEWTKDYGAIKGEWNRGGKVVRVNHNPLDNCPLGRPVGTFCTSGSACRRSDKPEGAILTCYGKLFGIAKEGNFCMEKSALAQVLTEEDIEWVKERTKTYTLWYGALLPHKYNNRCRKVVYGVEAFLESIPEVNHRGVGYLKYKGSAHDKDNMLEHLQKSEAHHHSDLIFVCIGKGDRGVPLGTDADICSVDPLDRAIYVDTSEPDIKHLIELAVLQVARKLKYDSQTCNNLELSGCASDGLRKYIEGYKPGPEFFCLNKKAHYNLHLGLFAVDRSWLFGGRWVSMQAVVKGWLGRLKETFATLNPAIHVFTTLTPVAFDDIYEPKTNSNGFWHQRIINEKSLIWFLEGQRERITGSCMPHIKSLDPTQNTNANIKHDIFVFILKHCYAQPCVAKSKISWSLCKAQAEGNIGSAGDRALVSAELDDDPEESFKDVVRLIAEAMYLNGASTTASTGERCTGIMEGNGDVFSLCTSERFQDVIRNYPNKYAKKGYNKYWCLKKVNN